MTGVSWVEFVDYIGEKVIQTCRLLFNKFKDFQTNKQAQFVARQKTEVQLDEMTTIE
jgi:hypothetical protein